MRRRYGRRRARSTGFIRMKFQSFMDISTSATSMQIITISAGGQSIIERLAPQFGAYKYYKIGRISVKLVPASTLPVDPTGLSYEAGEQTVDPRDQLTPGMMRITNGEDIFEDLTGVDGDVQHAIYNNMLLDPRWYKWMLQSGVKRFAYPRYWQIGQLHQDKWPGSVINCPHLDEITDLNGIPNGTGAWQLRHASSSGEYAQGNVSGQYIPNGSSAYGLFQTGHKGVLGWMPTDGLGHTLAGVDQPMLASPPEIEVMKILLPKAYKTVYYYRLFITEEVLFREPIVNFGIAAGEAQGIPYYFRPLDIFHSPGLPDPAMPTTPVRMTLNDSMTGGNDGSD